jgi:predicted DCC family thiol-disulfide oxidoreductase YuxK
MTRPLAAAPNQTRPILLYNDECGVCRRIARWVKKSAHRRTTGGEVIVVQPIGDDPAALRLINPDLGIWDAYETIHLVMPDGSMKKPRQANLWVSQSGSGRLPSAWYRAISACS